MVARHAGYPGRLLPELLSITEGASMDVEWPTCPCRMSKAWIGIFKAAGLGSAVACHVARVGAESRAEREQMQSLARRNAQVPKPVSQGQGLGYWRQSAGQRFCPRQQQAIEGGGRGNVTDPMATKRTLDCQTV